MLSDRDYVRQSLELNLFFLRIAKEHAFFIEVAIPQKNCQLIQQADMFKNEFERLLGEAIRMNDGLLTADFLNSGEIVTDLTLNAEQVSEFYFGIPLDTNLTRMELSLGGERNHNLSTLVDQVHHLNNQTLMAVRELINFKAQLLNDVLTCRVFTFNYPLLLDHILREARFYLEMLDRIQQRMEFNVAAEAVRQEAFWNRIMGEHAKFIRGLVDPTEVQLFMTANNLGNIFDVLTMNAESLVAQPSALPAVTAESQQATRSIRDFKRQGTEGLIQCQIRSVAYPLLGDHILREANHYLRLLRLIEASIGR